MTLLSIPSPAEGVWHIGPFPLRAYALCIILGVIAAIWIGERRWVARGGKPGQMSDLAIWAIPFGLVGGRAYHVLTDWQLYFGEGRDPITALYVWRGGLGIWGAIALGALGAFIGARVMGLRFTAVMDTLAPGLLVAQAIGRWGNYFNQELFGKPTDLPWALEIDAAHRPEGYYDDATFHPTFLYEFIWNLGAFGILIWLDRRFKLGFGRVMALYVASYTLGRMWTEYLRIDEVQMDDVAGLRLNVWVSIALFVLALVWFLVSARLRPGRESSIYLPGREPEDSAEADSADGDSADGDSADGDSADGDSADGDADAESDDEDEPSEDGPGEKDADDPPRKRRLLGRIGRRN